MTAEDSIYRVRLRTLARARPERHLEVSRPGELVQGTILEERWKAARRPPRARRLIQARRRRNGGKRTTWRMSVLLAWIENYISTTVRAYKARYRTI